METDAGKTMETLSETFKLHDKYQLEMKFTYPFDRTRKLNSYHVDTYLFFPSSLGLSPASYTKADFYADMQEYIRLKTPVVLLRGMMKGEDSPFCKLEQAMRSLAEQPEERARKDLYTERLKMFCSIMRSALRDEEQFLERSVRSINFKTLIEKYLDSSETILKEFRGLRMIVELPGISAVTVEFFNRVDEFLSITANKYRYKLWNFLNTENPDGWNEEIKGRLVTVIREEIAYRQACGYPSIPDPDGDNEELIYRESSLKKVMASVLFLKTTTRRDGVFLENLVFGIAAGIAMTFATVITFLTQHLLFSELSTLFFLIVVVSYVGKDRIKDCLKGFLQARVRRFLYDFKTEIRSGLGKKVGSCKESVAFVNELRVDPQILKVRHREYMAEMVNGGFGESVILARKHVTLSSWNCRNLFVDFKVDGIVDIMRLNVRKFLWKMDNPLREVFLPDEQGGIRMVRGKRVYHINIIIKYGMEGREDSYARYRIVLSRNGIKRIDTFPIVTSLNGVI